MQDLLFVYRTCCSIRHLHTEQQQERTLDNITIRHIYTIVVDTYFRRLVLLPAALACRHAQVPLFTAALALAAAAAACLPTHPATETCWLDLAIRVGILASGVLQGARRDAEKCGEGMGQSYEMLRLQPCPKTCRIRRRAVTGMRAGPGLLRSGLGQTAAVWSAPENLHIMHGTVRCHSGRQPQAHTQFLGTLSRRGAMTSYILLFAGGGVGGLSIHQR